ncbi:MAG: TetR/AcrR family transcriptional regulator [Fluviicola sp.]|nr:TetR/AcrR family transcriptional regulator [Fluviicola sp.]
MIDSIILKQPEGTYLKDPQGSDLGIKIIKESIELMEEIGIEDFTFKKLSIRIESTEASVYRYFESKHQLLLYLYSWYWGWKMVEIDRATHFISTDFDKLITAMNLLIQQENKAAFAFSFSYEKLRNLIEKEGIKSFLTKKVDDENQIGAFDNYKKLVALLSSWVVATKKDFQFPNMLITTIIEGAHLQHFFGNHLQRLTNHSDTNDNVAEFYKQLVQSLLVNK